MVPYGQRGRRGERVRLYCVVALDVERAVVVDVPVVGLVNAVGAELSVSGRHGEVGVGDAVVEGPAVAVEVA